MANYLLAKENDRFTLYCPDIFGIETWGGTSQVSLEKKRKYWYINHWTAGNDYVDDVTESYKLNVVLEATDLQEVLNYIIKTTNSNQAAIESILVQAQELQNERVAFENWAALRK
jgi:vacuolar-type H+-ATPase catalytic subunit A/Vma1